MFVFAVSDLANNSTAVAKLNETPPPPQFNVVPTDWDVSVPFLSRLFQIANIEFGAEGCLI